MINIISTQAKKTVISGPYKVFANLTKGLDKIGYPYVVNRDLDATRRLWIHDDVRALRYMHKSKAYKVVGPNLFVLPKDVPPGIRFDRIAYLHPSAWAAELWRRQGFSACRILPWPVGIDTDEFSPSDVPAGERRVMVYHKERDPQELPIILDALHRLKLRYSIVLYGHYTELEFKELLARTSFVVWHGRHESQGLALQEVMACDVPILLCDATSLAQCRSSYVFPGELASFSVTSAPYFDDTCGVRVTDLAQFDQACDLMVDRLGSFRPRDYVRQNLSLEGQARAFVALWEHWGLSFEEGYREQARTNREFRVPRRERLQRLAERAVGTLAGK